MSDLTVISSTDYDEILKTVSSASTSREGSGFLLTAPNLRPGQIRALVASTKLPIVHRTTLTLRTSPASISSSNSNGIILLSGPSPALEHAQAQLASHADPNEENNKEEVEVVLLGQDPALASGVKLVQEVLVLGNVALSAEALALGTKTGMSTRMIHSAIKSALGNSWAWENRITKALDGNYKGEKGDTIDEAVQVLTDYVKEAKTHKVSVPLLALIRQHYIHCSVSGQRDESTVAIIKSYGVDPAEKVKEAEKEEKVQRGGKYEGKVGFVGLGSMGFGMASILHKAELDVTGYDVWKGSSDKFAAAGAKTAATAKEACEGAKVVVLMVVNAEQAEGVLFDGGVAAAMGQGGAILLTSTVPPSAAKALQQKLSSLRSDLYLLDCPVSGGVARAALGDLTLLCSGDPRGLEAARPVLEAMSGTAGNAGNLWIIPGGIGSGSAVKMVHQALAGTQINMITETMAFAARLGLPLRLIHNLLIRSTGFCGVLGPRGKNMLDGKLSPDSTVDIWLKDLGIVTDEALELGVPVYYSTHVLQSCVMASSYGWGSQDDSSLTRLWEPAGIKVATPE